MSNIYYQNKDLTLYLDDSFKLLTELPSKSIDMVFADPPYFLSSGGISCNSGKQVIVDKGEWDKTINVEEKLNYNRLWLRLIRNVLKDDGTIWVSGTFHNIYTIGVALEMEGYAIINNITWIKPNPTPNLGCRCFTNSTETILWARKQLTKNKKGKHYFNYSLMKELNVNKQMKDAWLINLPKKEEKKYGKHPTQKPEALIERIILASTTEGDLVLDPFNGSGTTGVVAAKLKRKYIGIDNNKDYLEITKKRIEDMR